jgi:hypothetical protein
MSTRTPEKNREYMRQYRAKNKEKELERQRKYQAEYQERNKKAHVELTKTLDEALTNHKALVERYFKASNSLKSISQILGSNKEDKEKIVLIKTLFEK